MPAARAISRGAAVAAALVTQQTSKRAAALVIAAFATAILSATSLAAASARPKPGHYAGRTSERQRVTFQVADHGVRITSFSTVDGYNNKCHYSGATPHFFHYPVKVASMKIKPDRSFTATVKMTLLAGNPRSPRGTFRVRGRFSSGTAHGTVTRIRGRAGVVTCGSAASNPTTSTYLETFAAKPQ
jgi:hypothetical protein